MADTSCQTSWKVSPMLYCLNLMRVSQFIKVQKQSGFGKPRVLHRKLFLPIGSSNIDKLKPVPRKRKAVPKTDPV